MEQDAGTALADGKRPRTDGFLDEPSDGRRSVGEELLEGALRAAADAHEERKLRHLAAIFPSVAVREDVSAADAQWLVKTAEELSWRQMVVLSIVHQPPLDELRTQGLESREEPGLSEQRGLPCASAALQEEVEDLGRLGLLGVERSDGVVVRAGGTWSSIGNFWAVPIAKWRLTAAADLLVDVARLTDIEPAERDVVVRQMLEQRSG